MFEFLRVGRHGRLRELLSAYVDGQVSASEASRVQEHLAACAECRRELEALRATVSLLRSLPQVQPSRSFALAEAPEPADRRWPVAWGARAAMSVAGLVLAALLVGDAVGLVRQETGREPSLAAMEAEVVVEKEVIKEAPVEVVVTQEVIKEVPVEVVVVKEVQVPGETVVVTKEVPVEVQVEKVVTKEVIKEVPVEVVVTQEVVKEVQVPGETVVVTKEVPVEVQVEVVVEKEVIKEIPVEVVVTQEVIKEVMVPAETVVVGKEVVREVSVPGETVVVEKEVVEEVPVEVVVVKEVQVEAVMEKEVVKEESAPEPAVTPTAMAVAQATAAPAEERGTTTPADVSVPATPAARVAPTAVPPSPGDAGRERDEPPVATATPRGVLGPATLPGPVGRPQEARGPEGGIELPLWQMELAAGGLFLVLLLGTLWRARRWGRRR